MARPLILALALAALAAAGARAEVLTGGERLFCREAVAFSEARRGASVLVLKDGRTLCEAYGPGAGPDRPMEIWSGTKSFVGIMAAAAVQDGLLSLDEPVSKTLPEWRDDPWKAKATLRQVLSLSSGLRSEIGRPPEYAAAVLMPLSAEPGTMFAYGPAPFQLFGEVMTRKLAAAGQPSDPLAYLRRRVLGPIGLGEVVWRRTPGGDPLLPQGAVLTARQWATFGEFVRAGAVVDGVSLVDPVTFRELFRGSSVNPAYGVTWWLPARSAGVDVQGPSSDLGQAAARLPKDLVMAAGAGDQRLYVIPSRGLTVVRQARFAPMDALRPGAGPRWSDAAFVELVLQAP